MFFSDFSDSSSGEGEFGISGYKEDNPEFARYYKSYKKSRRQELSDENSSSSEEAFSDSHDDLLY